MAEIKDVLAYLWLNYPEDDRSDLSRSRLMGMAYLADWRSALQHQRTMTSAHWALGKWGPYSEEVYAILEHPKPPFAVVEEENAYGTSKGRVEVTEPVDTPTIEADDEAILRHVVEASHPLRWREFVGLIYSTYPIVAARDRFVELDLPGLVAEYRATERLLQDA